MATIYISIGSNINPSENIQHALNDLHQTFGEITCSTHYESKSVGFDGENFINLVASAKTDMDVLVVADHLHKIEDQHGRDRSGPKFSSRTLDLDLLLYDALVFEQGKLKIPRDEILFNAFVLCPLAELAPDLLHPIEQKRYAELWQAFDQASQPLWPIDASAL